MYFNNQLYHFKEINRTRLNVYEFEQYFPNITLGELARTYPNDTAVAVHVRTYQRKITRMVNPYIAERDFYLSAVPLPSDLSGFCYNRTNPAWDFVDHPPEWSRDWWMEDSAWRIWGSMPVLLMMVGMVYGYCRLQGCCQSPKQAAPINDFFSKEEIAEAQQKQVDLEKLNLTADVEIRLDGVTDKDKFICAICLSLLGMPESGELVMFVTQNGASCCRQKTSQPGQSFPYPLSVVGPAEHRYHPGCLFEAFKIKLRHPHSNEPVRYAPGALKFVENYQAEVEAELAKPNTV